MAVEILESCMVKPAEATPKHQIWLSIFDIVLGRTYTPMVYLYHHPCPAGFSPDMLKTALSKALVPFYPVAGRLRSDSSGRPEIHCTGDDDSVLFVTARAEATLDTLGNLAPSDELRRTLVPSSADGGGDHADTRLAMFQVTLFKCGGMSLGTATHHTLLDGRAAGNFMRMWAAMARGDTEAAMSFGQPCLDRTLLRGRSPPAVRFPHSEYPRRGSSSVPPSKTQVLPLFDTAILPVSKNQVTALKVAGAGAGGKEKVAVLPTTYSAVVAHAWRCWCTAKGLSGNADSRVYGAGCIRSRVHPPLPDGYFGNAIARMTTPATTKVNDIVSSPLGAVAGIVSAAAARLSDEYVRSLVDYLVLELELAMTMSSDDDHHHPPGHHLSQWVDVSDNDLLVVSWIGLCLNDLDFGWGQPAFRAFVNRSDLMFLVPSPHGGDGRLDVTVSMEPQALARFKELFYEGLNHYCTLATQIDGAQE